MADQPSTSDRRILTGVPRVGFCRDMENIDPSLPSENFIFPSCMRALMEYLGHPEYDYVHFMGVTGAAFFLNWKDGWHGDNKAIYYMVPIDEHTKLFEYAFDSTGYRLEVFSLKGENALDASEARRRIIESIDRGVPVLSHGIVGPPETSLIAGYDNSGRSVLGWSFYQYEPPDDREESVAYESNGMFRKREWLPSAWDLFIPGKRSTPVDPESVRKRALQWAVKVARSSRTWGDRHNGLAAYDAWARHLLRDDQILTSGLMPAGAEAYPFDVHNNAVDVVSEGRLFASKYLARVAGEEVQMASELYEASSCCVREYGLMKKVRDCVGGAGRTPEHAGRFVDPQTRREIVTLIREARNLDERSINHVENALRVVEADE